MNLLALKLMKLLRLGSPSLMRPSRSVLPPKSNSSVSYFAANTYYDSRSLTFHLLPFSHPSHILKIASRSDGSIGGSSLCRRSYF